jgi:hypothetical protein
MIPTLRILQPRVFQNVSAAMVDPAPLTSPVVVTSDHGQVRVAKFYGSGTWTKASNQSFVVVFAWNGGCGGGSGRRGRTGGAGSDFQGGAGGAPGNAMMLMLPSYYFGTSTTITVGAGGAGGASITAANTNGATGSTGGSTSIGSITIPQTGTGGTGGGTGGTGGTGGMSTYVMSGGYVIPSGQQTGSSPTTTVYSTMAYVPDYTIIGGGTIQMPCLPFMVSTGGGAGVAGAQIATTPTPGGDINLFGNAISIGGQGVANVPVGTLFDKIIATNGTYFQYPYGGAANNNQGMMFVTGGTGGGGAGDNAVTGGHPLAVQGGGNGGIGAGGGGGGGASGNGGTTYSGPGGNGGPGLVIIYEFI